MGCACVQIIRSLAGHGRGRLLCVLDTDGPHLLLYDGKRRKLKNPRRKEAAHTAPAGDFQYPILGQLRIDGNLSNRNMRRVLATFRAEELRRV